MKVQLEAARLLAYPGLMDSARLWHQDANSDRHRELHVWNLDRDANSAHVLEHVQRSLDGAADGAVYAIEEIIAGHTKPQSAHPLA